MTKANVEIDGTIVTVLFYYCRQKHYHAFRVHFTKDILKTRVLAQVVSQREGAFDKNEFKHETVDEILVHDDRRQWRMLAIRLLAELRVNCFEHRRLFLG